MQVWACLLKSVYDDIEWLSMACWEYKTLCLRLHDLCMKFTIIISLALAKGDQQNLITFPSLAGISVRCDQLCVEARRQGCSEHGLGRPQSVKWTPGDYLVWNNSKHTLSPEQSINCQISFWTLEVSQILLQFNYYYWYRPNVMITAVKWNLNLCITY